MAGWLPAAVSVGLGILGAGGQSQTNRMNRDMARDQMRFQERMSSTAAQRAVEDYRAAGLNPALAYGNTASSPGGASAVMGDATAAGISTAQQARALDQQLRIAREQSRADYHLKMTQAHAATQAAVRDQATANLTSAQLQQTAQAIRFAEQVQPHHLRQAAAEATLRQHLIPGAANTARWESMLGTGSPGISTARAVSEILKTLFR